VESRLTTSAIWRALHVTIRTAAARRFHGAMRISVLGIILGRPFDSHDRVRRCQFRGDAPRALPALKIPRNFSSRNRT
jgi:hypothetical protein